MANIERDMTARLHSLRLQLRQDYIFLLVNTITPQVVETEAVNERYEYEFQNGCCLGYIIRACAATSGRIASRDLLEQAVDYCRQRLSCHSGDGELLIHDGQIYGILGIAETGEAAAETFHALRRELQELPGSLGYQWTIGLGVFVEGTQDLLRSIQSAQHAIKYSIIHGIGHVFDANRDEIVYEGALTLQTAAEEVMLQQAILKLEPLRLKTIIAGLFQDKQAEIAGYPVFAYMLALDILKTAIQTLRDSMPVDRRTYEIEQRYEREIDRQNSLEALIAITTEGVNALYEQYRLYAETGNSRPVWGAICYIRDHFREHLTLNMIGDAVNRNPQYISNMFTRECGMTVSDYITSLRIEEAKRLLLSTDEPLALIAEEVGYRDAKYFSRAFRSRTGVSPSQWKKDSTAHGR